MESDFTGGGLSGEWARASQAMRDEARGGSLDELFSRGVRTLFEDVLGRSTAEGDAFGIGSAVDAVVGTLPNQEDATGAMDDMGIGDEYIESLERRLLRANSSGGQALLKKTIEDELLSAATVKTLAAANLCGRNRNQRMRAVTSATEMVKQLVASPQWQSIWDHFGSRNAKTWGQGFAHPLTRRRADTSPGLASAPEATAGTDVDGMRRASVRTRDAVGQGGLSGVGARRSGNSGGGRWPFDGLLKKFEWPTIEWPKAPKKPKPKKPKTKPKSKTDCEKIIHAIATIVAIVIAVVIAIAVIGVIVGAIMAFLGPFWLLIGILLLAVIRTWGLWVIVVAIKSIYEWIAAVYRFGKGFNDGWGDYQGELGKCPKRPKGMDPKIPMTAVDDSYWLGYKFGWWIRGKF